MSVKADAKPEVATLPEFNKSKMAAAKPKVLMNRLPDEIQTKF